MFPVDYHAWMKQLIASAQEKQFLYLIGTIQNRQQFYYSDFEEWETDEDDVVRLIWTPAKREAFLFETEQEVEEFKCDFISPRRASIIRIMKPPQEIIDLMI